MRSHSNIHCRNAIVFHLLIHQALFRLSRVIIHLNLIVNDIAQFPILTLLLHQLADRAATEMRRQSLEVLDVSPVSL